MKSELIFSDILPGLELEEASQVNQFLTRLDILARKAVEESVPKGSIIAFSGGIDSSILATLTSEKESQLLTLGVHGSSDALENLNVPLDLRRTVERITRNQVELAAIEVAKLVKVATLSHFEDCLAFFLIGEKLPQNVERTLVTANGPDELFCGYDRFRRLIDGEKETDDGESIIQEEIRKSIELAHLLRREVKKVLQNFGWKSAEPFLEKDFAAFCQSIPVNLKISQGEDKLRKRLWRVYGRMLGVSEEIVMKPKKAMQYSMGLHGIILNMLKKGKLNPEITKGSLFEQA